MSQARRFVIGVIDPRVLEEQNTYTAQTFTTKC